MKLRVVTGSSVEAAYIMKSTAAMVVLKSNSVAVHSTGKPWRGNLEALSKAKEYGLEAANIRPSQHRHTIKNVQGTENILL